MPVGLAVTKAEIDTRAGDIARTFQKQFTDVGTFKAFLDRTADADLVALGYTTQEVADLKSAYADAWQLTTIYTGDAALPAAKDFRVFLGPLGGVGSF